MRLVRSGGAGTLAGATDLVTLTLLVRAAGVSPRAASVPALVLGAIVMFFGQKYLAFRTSGKPRVRELVAFTLVQLGGLLLTAWLFDLLLSLVPLATSHYVVSRMIVTNCVWLGYSFPLWHFVFRRPSPEQAGH